MEEDLALSSLTVTAVIMTQELEICQLGLLYRRQSSPKIAAISKDRVHSRALSGCKLNS
jgi:hypothetical protein